MNIAACLKALCWLVIGLTFRAYSYDNFCVEKSWPASRPSHHCQGKVIPSHKTRNFRAEQLLCDSGSHTKTRGPVPFDEEEWRDLHNADSAAAKDMLRALPVPEWAGRVQYSSHLHWSWEDCQLITSYACGSDEVCTTTTDADGKEHESCHSVPRTCYMDIVVSESEHCSNETLTYEVQYEQIDKKDTGYLARLANGFDLLPGEQEGVTVDNGIGHFHGATMSPQLSVKEPRNDYLITRMSGGSYEDSSFMCRQYSNYHIGFNILPRKRIRSRSGNAFSLPESFDGEKVEPLIWQGAKGSDERWYENGYPAALRLQDYSSTTMNEFAQDMGDMFKNVVVRIQLYDKSTFGWPSARNTIYVNERKAVAQTLNALSDNQKVRRSQLWELMLATNSVDPRKNLYRNHIPWLIYYPARLLLPAEDLSYENQLTPGTEYQVKLTVYQRGLSIYHQACEDDPEAWDCRFYAGGGWFSPTRYESGYYSDKSLDIHFTTPENVNQRSYWPMFWNTMSGLSNLGVVGAAGVIAYGALRMAGGI